MYITIIILICKMITIYLYKNSYRSMTTKKTMPHRKLGEIEQMPPSLSLSYLILHTFTIHMSSYTYKLALNRK